jgi:hypothetical protein
VFKNKKDMHLKYESVIREALVDGKKDYHQVTEDICAPIENKAHKALENWFFNFSLIAYFWGI